MLSWALEKLAEHSLLTAIIFAGFVVFGLVVFKLTSFYLRTNNICNEHAGIRDKLDLLLNKFNSLIAVLSESGTIKDSKFFSTNSPLNLTPDGLSLIEQIGWKNVLENKENKDLLFSILDKFGLKTKYDVEKYCIILLNELNTDRKITPFTEIKKYLYEHAEIDEKNVIIACAIYLRDKYLEIHQEIK